MSRIDRFFAKPVECDILGEKYMLKPFSVKDLPLLSKLDDKENLMENTGALLDCVYLLAKQIDPECTREQMDELSLESVEAFSNAIAKVNDIDVDEAKKALLEKIKAKQNGSQ